MSDISKARKIWRLLTPAEQRTAVVLVALMFVGTALEMLSIGLVIPAIALLMRPDFITSYAALRPLSNALGDVSHQELVVGAMLVMVGIYLFKTGFLAFLAWRQTSYCCAVQARMSQALFAAYLRQPYPFHLQRNSAELIRNAVNEVNIFTFQVMIPGMTLLAEALVVPGLCVLLVIVEPLGALIAVAVLGSVGWLLHGLTKDRSTRWGKARQHHEGLLLQHLQQGLGAVKELKLLGREAQFLAHYAHHTSQSARAGQNQLTFIQLPRLCLELIAVTGLALLVVTMLAQGRDPAAIVPTLALFAAAAFRLMPSVNRILGSLQSLGYGTAAINALYEEFRIAVPAAQRSSARRRAFDRVLEFDDVSYTYPGAASAAIRNVSLAIRRGEFVGLIGPSGAGKTTLVDVLLGLLVPDAGEVRLDGENIQSFLRDWQDQVGYVPQTIYLTDDSLRSNVAFGLPAHEVDESALWRAIRAAQLDEFVRSLPNGVDTIVGERGVRLSGGQRQRIAIARALYHDPAVLVLDEASSALDSATERDFMQAVGALHGAKTIVVIAHRLSTVAHCDTLYQLEAGRIVTTGTPQTMLGAAAAVRAGQA